MKTPLSAHAPVQTDIPFRLDRLTWSRFHLLVVLGLGITWILDGLEVTIVGSLGPALQSHDTLGQVERRAGCGRVVLCGRRRHRRARLRLDHRPLWTPARFLCHPCGLSVRRLLSALAWDFWSFAFFRLLTGLGIGGEYAAVNSAIDELIPAKYRGRVDLIVNGSFWLGAACGALATPLLLNPAIFPVNLGWRLGFGIGGIAGSAILLLRRFVPESPRWLVTHCREQEGEAIVAEIESTVAAETGEQLSRPSERLVVHPRKSFGLKMIFAAMLEKYRERSILALTLMIAQSFLYNGVFFTFGLILAHFYHVENDRIGFYVLPLAIGNFCGPLLLGTLFDTVGRRKMIALTFGLSGILLIVTALLFGLNYLTAATQTIAGSSSSSLHRPRRAQPISRRVRSSRWRRGHWPSPASMRWAPPLAAASPLQCSAA